MKILVLLIFLTTTLLPAQPIIQWQKALGGSDYDQARSIQQTSDGGYIVAGRTLSTDGNIQENHGAFDFFIVKLDDTGSVKWTKNYGGSDNDLAYSLRQTTDGGYIVAGYTESNDGDISGNHGDKDAWIVKLNSSGNIEWQKALGGTGWDEAWSIELTFDGGYILAGRSSSNDGDAAGNLGGSLDFWIVKLSSSGNIEWQKALGGSDEDTALSIRQSSDSGYIIAGSAKSNDGDVEGNNGNVDFWIVKLNNSGEVEWQNALGGTGLDVATDILETPDGYIAGGYSGSHNSGDVTDHQGSFDYWIVKLNKGGELVWQKTLGGSDADYIRSIAQTSDGMFVVAGETKSNDGDVVGNNGILVIWVVKLNEAGEVIWKKTFGGTQGDGGASIQQTSDNGFILAGYAWSNDGDVSGNHGKADFWVVKLTAETTATTDLKSSTLDISPNPAFNSIVLNTVSDEPFLAITIKDLMGREILRQANPSDGHINVASTAPGLYFVVAKTASGKVFSGKLVKEK